MRILITAGPTREPIDAVRYIGNRSSGKMGAALAEAAVRAGHGVTVVLGPVSVAPPETARTIEVETARQMLDAVLREFPAHDLLIMAAAVSDFRPARASSGKLARADGLTLTLEPTQDIAAAAGKMKRTDQRTIGFSLEAGEDIERARRKLTAKNLDLIVLNSTQTIGSGDVAATLLYADGREEKLASRSKPAFADILIGRGELLLGSGPPRP